MNSATIMDQSFSRLWLASAISAIGTRMQQFALMYYLTVVSHEAKWVGIVIGAAWIGRSIVLLFAGEWIQQLGVKKVLLFTSLTQALPAVSLAVLFLSDKINPWPIVFIEAFAGALTGLELPARATIFPLLVPENHLLKVAMLGHASQTIGFVFGPLAGALCIGYVSYPSLFIFNAMTFALVAISATTSSPQKIAKSESKTKGLNAYLQGFKLLFDTKRLHWHLCLILLGVGLVCPILSLIAPMSQLALHGNAWSNMLLTVLYGLGATLGMVFMSWISHRCSQETAAQATMIACVMVGIAYAQAPSLIIAAVLIGIFGVVECIAFEGGAMALVQSHLPKEHLGRMTAAYFALWNFIFAMGNIILGFVADIAGIRKTLTLGSLFFGIIFAFAWAQRKWRNKNKSKKLSAI